jgi:hypothetical protein
MMWWWCGGGALCRITEVLAKLRANVKDIEHERAFLLENVGITQPVFTLETRGWRLSSLLSLHSLPSLI